MVRRASLPLLLAALLAVTLTGCAFFTASMFPGYLAQAEASFELGPQIDAFLSGHDYVWHSQVFILRSPAGANYGAVLIEIDSYPGKQVILVSPSGTVRAVSNPELGRLHLTDASGQFIVGRVPIDPDTLVPGSANPSIDSSWLGYSYNADNYLLHTDSADSTLLYYGSAGSWPVMASSYVSIDYSNGYELRGLFYDDAPPISGREVIPVFYNFNFNRTDVLLLPAAGFDGTLAWVTPLRDNYPRLELYDVDGGNVHYTRKGIVVADWDGRAELRDFSGKDTGKRLFSADRGEVKLAFDLEGETFFAFDVENRMLYRGRTGW